MMACAENGPNSCPFPARTGSCSKTTTSGGATHVSVWLDHEAATPDERFKATMFCRTGAARTKLDNYNPGLLLLASPDRHPVDPARRPRRNTRRTHENDVLQSLPQGLGSSSHRIHLQHPTAATNERARAYWETRDFFRPRARPWRSGLRSTGMSEQPADLREATKAASAEIELGNSLPQIY